ncbi:RNA polymerase sigma factor [Agathobaculum sp. Marseille-P7918]|uniref:RNA polymerase sigma factor n=1 Tax=Agathobaculum sp. Marseille-P7918 TaxID=2479843 RepID=UPI003564743C
MPPQKSQEELTALYHRNIDAVYRLCYVYLRNHADAEDAVQSVFLRYLQKRPEFHDMSHETAWLLLTAKNCCRDQLRTWWRRQRVDLDTLPEPTACTDAETRETLHILLSLPEKYRVPLYLHYIEGYPAKELSPLLGCRESTVRTRLQRGRSLMKRQLGGICDDTQHTGNAQSNRTTKRTDTMRHPGET